MSPSNSSSAWPGVIEAYREFLPVTAKTPVVTLLEGSTPLVLSPRLGERLGRDCRVYLKYEGLNPTGSFKARGLACAVSMCVELGIRKVAIPSAGNAASAMAAYAAAAGIEAHIFMPRDVPQSNFIECKAFGARVTGITLAMSSVYLALWIHVGGTQVNLFGAVVLAAMVGLSLLRARRAPRGAP